MTLTDLKRLVSCVYEGYVCTRSLRRTFLSFALILLLTIPSDAQPVLTASFDRQEAVVGETVSLRFLLEGSSDAEGFLPPDFSGFAVVHGPDTRMEVLTHHGRKVPTVTFAYLLRPERSGILKLGSASVKSDQCIVGSLPIFIRVSQTAASRPSDESPPLSNPQLSDRIRKGLFVRLETAKTEVYVGEPLLVTYKLYTRLNSESEVLRRPSFAGFSVVEVQRSDSASPVEEVVDGQRFQAYVLRKVHLIPLREGIYELEPLLVRNRVSLEDPASTDGESSLSRLLSRLYPQAGHKDRARRAEVDVQSPSRTIRVRPLPSGAPSDFTGAVGRFSLALESGKDTLGMGEPGRLKVVLVGSGNLPLALPPHVEWPKEMEAYEPDLIEETDPDRTTLSGKRTWVFPFSPKRTGLFPIKPASMSAFDPSTGKYYPVKADPVFVTVVAEGKGSPSIEAPSSDGVHPFIPILIVAVLSAVVGMAVFFRSKRRMTHVRGEAPVVFDQPGHSPAFDVRTLLSDAERLVSEGLPADGCRELGRALSGLAESRFGVNASAGMERFTEELVSTGWDRGKAEEWADLIRGCEIEAYRPVADAASAGRLLERARILLGSV
jgi:hypothetical protein